MKKDLYQRVNDIVLEGLKKDGLKWFMPWKSGSDNAPFNMGRKSYYNGFNIFMLNAVMADKGYEFNQWMTWKQAKDLGGSVRLGEKSSAEVFYWGRYYYDNKLKKYIKATKKINVKEQYEGKNRYKEVVTLQYSNVFNIAQCDGIEPIKGDTKEIVHEPNEFAEDIISNYLSSNDGLEITHIENKAYYNLTRDFVNMPRKEVFVDSDSYYKTLFHELAHSTGHKDRLNRSTLLEVNFWGDNTYAKEELVAEISSMYMVGLTGLSPNDSDENSQAYIKSWTKKLINKPRECVYAMQQASKVVDYLMQ